MTPIQADSKASESNMLHATDKVIPILPCPDITTQVQFYQQLGFELLEAYTSPNPYAVMQLGSIELHFYGSKKMIPSQNSSMSFIKVADVEAVYQLFTHGLKKHTGKIPRSGIPRISKVRDLSYDRRFTLTDTGGNTLFIGTPVKSGTHNFFRSLHNQALAKKFTVLYDVLFSKEDPEMAASMLPKFLAEKELLEDEDKAKLLLIALSIQRQLGQAVEDNEVKALLALHQEDGEDWDKINKRYLAILQEE